MEVRGFQALFPPAKRSRSLGDRHPQVDFVPEDGGVRVSVPFDPETESPIEQQVAGCQAILDSFKRYGGHGGRQLFPADSGSG